MGLRKVAKPGQAAGPQSPANETGPLFPVVEHGKWGYIDKTGQMVIPPQYSNTYRFSEGLAAVQKEFNKWGYIDKTGKIVIPLRYSFASGFSEGLAAVIVGDKMLYIDKTGKYVWASTK